MQVKDEAADVDDAYRSVEVNEPPVASFTGTTDGLTLDVDASDSYDNDGDSLTYEWDWDDGTSDTTTSETYSHTYDVCPDWTFDVVLKVHDGNGGDDSAPDTVNVRDYDDDGDGLVNCTENNGPDWDGDGASDNSTDPNDPDTDGEGLNDGEEVNTHNSNPNDQHSDTDGLDDAVEVNSYNTDPADRDTDDDEFHDGREIDPAGASDSHFSFIASEAQDVFFGDGGSPCAYPDPTTPDFYLEVDGVLDDCGTLTSCDTHMLSSDDRDKIVQSFADQGINAYIDTGQFANDEQDGER
jgi:hypothetical protein